MAGYEYCKVVEFGKCESGDKLYCVINMRFPNVGKPYTFGDKRTAEKAYAEQVLFVPYSEYKQMKKTGYVSAYRTRKI